MGDRDFFPTHPERDPIFSLTCKVYKGGEILQANVEKVGGHGVPLMEPSRMMEGFCFLTIDEDRRRGIGNAVHYLIYGILI